jgi:hypothetical protein
MAASPKASPETTMETSSLGMPEWIGENLLPSTQNQIPKAKLD